MEAWHGERTYTHMWPRRTRTTANAARIAITARHRAESRLIHAAKIRMMVAGRE
jgi:hypothetical protein